jgi:FkbM family methyltransferase
MLTSIYKSLSQFPNFKGKLFILEKFYQSCLSGNERFETQTWTDLKLKLLLKDRIQRRIFVKKSHEKETEIHMLKFAENANYFLDVGANIGYFSLMLAHKFPHLKVLSFEPNPNNVAQIKTNIEINNLKNISINEMCLSNQKGNVEFAIPPMTESGWGRINDTSASLEGFTKINVPCETLDSLYESGAIAVSKPMLIKMDIEGFEEQALKGAENILKNIKPILCIELNEACLVENGSSSQNIIRYLTNMGYTAYVIDKGNLKKINSPKENYKFLNYFFLP